MEHIALEKDIENLARAIKEKPAEQRKEALRAAIKEHAYPTPVATAPQPAQARPTPSDQGPLPSYLNEAPDEIKLRVEKLLDMAWHKGLIKAFKEARKGGQLVLDAFHDAITDKLYDEFKKRELL